MKRIVVYVNPDKRDTIAKLNGSAVSIIMHIYFEMKVGSNIVILRPDEVMKGARIKTEKTYRLGIKQLIAYNIIKRTKLFTYEVNKEFAVCDTEDNTHHNGTGLITGYV